MGITPSQDVSLILQICSACQLVYTILVVPGKPVKKSASSCMTNMRYVRPHLDFDTSIALHGTCSVAGASLFVFFRVRLLLGVRAQLLLHDQLPPAPRGQLPKDLPEVLGYLLHTQPQVFSYRGWAAAAKGEKEDCSLDG